MTLNIAHRGARSLAPENTLAAAKKALEVGADMWELDLSVTADGELIVMHDDTLARTTNADQLFPNRVPWQVNDFTLVEIKQLDTAAAFINKDPFEQIAAGVIGTNQQRALKGEPVPTLEEALRFTRAHNWRVNVEIKALPPPQNTFPVVDRVVDLINSLDMAGQVLISSYVPFYLKRAKDLNPTLDIAVLTSGPMSVAEALRYQRLGIALTPMHYFNGDAPLSFLSNLNSQVYHPHYSLLSLHEIRKVQESGVAVNLWTVNDRTHMERLVRAGANGIITDYPQVLAEILSAAAN